MPGAVGSLCLQEKLDAALIRGIDDRHASPIVEGHQRLGCRVGIALTTGNRVPPSVRTLRRFQIARQLLQCGAGCPGPQKAEQLVGPLLGVARRATLEEFARATAASACAF
jgi:hypothetical protein